MHAADSRAVVHRPFLQAGTLTVCVSQLQLRSRFSSKPAVCVMLKVLGVPALVHKQVLQTGQKKAGKGHVKQ